MDEMDKPLSLREAIRILDEDQESPFNNGCECHRCRALRIVLGAAEKYADVQEE
jgi:hypothetical protein